MNTQFFARGDTAEIWLYDQIGADWFGDGITAKSFQKELSALGKVNTINLRINSPGGDVFDGVTIHNLLAQHPARVVVDVDGLAASIASVIAMAGDEIRMASNSMMMIHNPMSMAYGDEREMQRTAALLSQVKGTLVDTYTARTGGQRASVSALMDDETWLTAQDAVDNGFADSITAEQRVSACFGLLNRYRNTPSPLRATAPQAGSQTDIARVRVAQQRQRLSALGMK